MLRKFQVVATVADPRYGDEKVVFEVQDVIWDVAWKLAQKWSKMGYWSSVYNLMGECVDEAYPADLAMEAV
jgi:hypothetical protein